MGEFRGWGGAAVVTGASDGIGRELARRFAGRGIDLVLVARSEEKLRLLADQLTHVHGIRAMAVPADLSAEEGPASLVDALEEADLTVDVLVNNAAFGTYGPFARAGVDREREMIRLNVSAPTELAARLLPGMRARGHGLLVNVASTAAFAPVPWLGTYSATKAYVLSWTQALDVELRGTGVRACVLCPGTTETRFHAVSGAEGDRGSRLPAQTPGAVADECLRGIDRGRRVIVTGALNRAHTAVAGVLPDGLVARITDRVMRPENVPPPRGQA